MKPEHINMARDVIAARKTHGSDRTADNNPSQRATEAKADYIRLSLDPNCGWEAALNEIATLKMEADVARRCRDDERDEHDELVRSLRSRIDRLQREVNGLMRREVYK